MSVKSEGGDLKSFPKLAIQSSNLLTKFINFANPILSNCRTIDDLIQFDVLKVNKIKPNKVHIAYELFKYNRLCYEKYLESVQVTLHHALARGDSYHRRKMSILKRLYRDEVIMRLLCLKLFPYTDIGHLAIIKGLLQSMLLISLRAAKIIITGLCSSKFYEQRFILDCGEPRYEHRSPFLMNNIPNCDCMIDGYVYTVMKQLLPKTYHDSVENMIQGSISINSAYDSKKTGLITSLVLFNHEVTVVDFIDNPTVLIDTQLISSVPSIAPKWLQMAVKAENVGKSYLSGNDPILDRQRLDIPIQNEATLGVVDGIGIPPPMYLKDEGDCPLSKQSEFMYIDSSSGNNIIFKLSGEASTLRDNYYDSLYESDSPELIIKQIINEQTKKEVSTSIYPSGDEKSQKEVMD